METSVKYQELKNGQTKLQQIEEDLESASLKLGEMKFIDAEIGGMTAGQAVYGFSSIYRQSIELMHSLNYNTQSFLESVGIAFEDTDNFAAKEIEK